MSISSRNGLGRRRLLALAALSGFVLPLTGCGGSSSADTGKASNPYGLIEAGTIRSATQTGQPPSPTPRTRASPPGSSST